MAKDKDSKAKRKNRSDKNLTKKLEEGGEVLTMSEEKTKTLLAKVRAKAKAMRGVIKKGDMEKADSKDIWWKNHYKELIDFVGDLSYEDQVSYLKAKKLNKATIDAEMNGTAKQLAQTFLHLFTIQELNDIINEGGSMAIEDSKDITR